MENNFHSEAINNIFKTQARRAVNLIAFTSVISSVLTYMFYVITAVALPFLSKLIYGVLLMSGSSKSYALAFAGNFVGGEELSWFISILSTLLCFFLPFAMLAKKLMQKEDENIVPVKGSIMKSFPFVYCAALMMASVTSRITGNIFSFLLPDAYSAAVSGTAEIYGTSTSPSSLILSFIAMCVLAPIAEEFVYRGVAFGYLKKFGVSFAALSSSLFFGLAHANAEQIAYAFVFGLVLCAVTFKTGNLKTAIIMHFINNLIGYVNAYIFPLVNFHAADAVFTVIYNIFIGVFAIIGMIILFKSGQKKENGVKVNAPAACIFCAGTVFVIIFSVINIISGML